MWGCGEGGCVCEAGQGGPPAAGTGGGLGAAVARTLGSGGAASRACLKIAFRQLCVPLCGRFGPDEGGVAGYVDRIGAKSPAKWGVQMAGMNFQTHPKSLPA